ncbi:MAG: hypothetical protein ACRYG2_37690 [Janthinobacterium lividum]
MSVTTDSIVSAERSLPRRTAHLVLTLLGLVLVAVLLGQGVPAAHAASPAAASSTVSTENVGPLPGRSQDTVYVTSDATSRRPVKTPTERLSKGSPLTLVFVKTCPVRACAAQPAVQCITVSSGDLGGGTLAGTTHRTYDESTNKLATVPTTLDDRWANNASYADRLNIAEHELGHGVGLHAKRTSSIMDAVTHGKTKPAAGDLRDLSARY